MSISLIVTTHVIITLIRINWEIDIIVTTNGGIIHTHRPSRVQVRHEHRPLTPCATRVPAHAALPPSPSSSELPAPLSHLRPLLLSPFYSLRSSFLPLLKPSRALPWPPPLHGELPPPATSEPQSRHQEVARDPLQLPQPLAKVLLGPIDGNRSSGPPWTVAPPLTVELHHPAIVSPTQRFKSDVSNLLKLVLSTFHHVGIISALVFGPCRRRRASARHGPPLRGPVLRQGAPRMRSAPLVPPATFPLPAGEPLGSYGRSKTSRPWLIGSGTLRKNRNSSGGLFAKSMTYLNSS